MKYYIGADLGTSALKLLLVDKNGEIKSSVSEKYPVIFPKEGWSEQDPEDWWNAFVRGTKRLVEGINAEDICGIGIGGQMHGLVILDKDDKVIRPAILWNDGRTAPQTDHLNEVIGKDTLLESTANIAFAGFTAPKLLWLKENEPESFAKIRRIMLPKDYLNFRLTGVFSTDYSDASGLLLLDVKNKCWSQKMLDICGISEDMLPRLFESYQKTGCLLSVTAELLGLKSGICVAAGAGDNAAAAIGTGTLGNGVCNISLGTSGTVFLSSESFFPYPDGSIHSFCHADGSYHLMGCMLSAASCNKWFCDEILKTADYSSEQAAIADSALGENSVLFLPYLMGERSFVNDTSARGVFAGLHMNTSRSDMIQAIFEGVSFAVKDNFEAMRALGIDIARVSVCGGGARSPLWRKILCNILAAPITVPAVEEGPGYGAAMLAMTANGEYEDISACAKAVVKQGRTEYPDPELTQKYSKKYQSYKKLYPALKEIFKEASK